MSWMRAIADNIPTRSETQVTYKYDNLKRAHRDAVQMINSSGWGLDKESINSGNGTIKGIYNLDEYFL
jgi:hypothetical protein